MVLCLPPADSAGQDFGAHPGAPDPAISRSQAIHTFINCKKPSWRPIPVSLSVRARLRERFQNNGVQQDGVSQCDEQSQNYFTLESTNDALVFTATKR
jgi:hypothetical protein